MQITSAPTPNSPVTPEKQDSVVCQSHCCFVCGLTTSMLLFIHGVFLPFFFGFRCECLSGLCGFPVCEVGSTPRIVSRGDGTPGKCCDVFECVNGTWGAGGGRVPPGRPARERRATHSGGRSAWDPPVRHRESGKGILTPAIRGFATQKHGVAVAVTSGGVSVVQKREDFLVEAVLTPPPLSGAGLCN